MGEEPSIQAFEAIIARPAMPPEIASAIVKVMMKITPLTKDTRNKFQNYDYVSVDQFYDLVGRLMAEEGIFTLLFERDMSVAERKTTTDRGDTKTSVWLQATYDVWLYHTTGAAFGPVTRSIIVPASGAQSYASAISFVEKYYLRSLFKIPTGDGDEDGNEKRELPAARGRGNGPERRDPPRDERPQDDDAAQSKVFTIQQSEREWGAIKSQAGMTKWWKDHLAALSDIFDGMEDPLYLELRAKYTKHGKGLPEKDPVDATEPTGAEAHGTIGGGAVQ